MAKFWLDKHPIIHEDHSHDLESRAAIHEFKGGLSRSEAEAKAHKEYVHNLAVESAAHHLVGMKIAQATGDDDSAQKHSAAYASAVVAMGHAPVGPTPQAVLDHVKKYHPSPYKFKSHAHDEVIPQLHVDDGVDERLQGHLDKIKDLRNQLKS